MFLNETKLGYKDTNRLKVEGQGKKFHANTNQKKAGEAKILDRVYFRAKNIPRDRKSFHNAVRLDLSKGHKNPKYLCI